MIPTSTDITISAKSTVPANTQAVVVFIPEGLRDSSGLTLGDEDRKAVDRLLAGGIVRGKAREVAFDVVEAGKGTFRRTYVAGLGKPEKLSAESIRQAAGAVIRALRKHRLSRAAWVVPTLANVTAPASAEALVTGALLAAFDFQEYKGTGRKKEDEPATKRVELTLVIGEGDAKALRAAIDRARAIADGQNFARTIASRPGNNINPPVLAKVAKEMALEAGLHCRVLDEKEMTKLGMGGILAVGAASIDTPPRMIVLEWPGAGGTRAGKTVARGKATAPGKPLLVIGKAITFDTGGISIKPADKMQRMIFDKCGGMAVLGLMYAVAKLNLPVHVVGILSSAENALSDKAYRPGDILRMYNGVTVEVTNTDAEGRLVLGDALAWGIETYRPAAVVDLATLTGGVIVALGKTMAGVMSNNDRLVEELQSAAESAGEKIWRLPVGDEQREQMKSDPADILNSAGRDAAPLQGAAFLSFFVPMDDSVPWAHLDIAGVADTEKDLPLYAKGATGWGVRTLVEWVGRNVE